MNKKHLRDIIEVKRAPERAEKLWHYLVKKHKEDDGWTQNITKSYHSTHYFPGLVPSNFKAAELEDVPLKKIYSSQDTVLSKSIIDKIHHRGKNNPEHPWIVHDTKRDVYHLYDGNHRVAAAKLRGDSHIKARVIKR